MFKRVGSDVYSDVLVNFVQVCDKEKSLTFVSKILLVGLWYICVFSFHTLSPKQKFKNEWNVGNGIDFRALFQIVLPILGEFKEII